MTYKRTARLLASGLLLSLLSMPAAQAAGYINGSFSVIGGFDCGGCIAPGNDFVVSRLMLLEAANPATAAAGSGTFAGLGGAAVVPMRAIELVNPPLEAGQFEVDGFTITIRGVRDVMRRPLVCTAGGCQDSLRVGLWGEIEGNGYRPAGIVGIWTGQGSCLGRGGVCTSVPSASWSASFSAVRIAEPAGPGLLGLGLLGLGLAARRRPRQAPVTTAAWG
jgi:MYXO-CTERM domain-containing protein